MPDPVPPLADLEDELHALRRAFGGEVIKLTYGITERPDRPLEVERVPAGELL